MEKSNKKIEDIVVEKTTNIEHADCVRTFQSRKVVLSKKTEKVYSVTVKYIRVSDEDATMKRSIVQSIMKKGFLKKDV